MEGRNGVAHPRKGYIHAYMHEAFYCAVTLPKSKDDPANILPHLEEERKGGVAETTGCLYNISSLFPQ